MMGDETEILDAKSMMQGNWLPASNTVKEAPLPQDKVVLYEEAFNKISDATGITDVEEVVSTFLEAEDKNFSLFNYVNELNSEIERLELAISDTKVEIEKYKGQGVSTDTQRKQILRNLDERLQNTKTKAAEYQTRYDNGMKTINQVNPVTMSRYSLPPVSNTVNTTSHTIRFARHSSRQVSTASSVGWAAPALTLRRCWATRV